MKDKRIPCIATLSFFGILTSLYSLLHKTGFASGEFCDINGTFSCDIVNQGPYSEIAGIPIALIGVIGYSFLFIAACMKMRMPSDKGLTRFLVIASFGALAFSLYLTSIEAFVLNTWCIVCLTSQLLILLIAILAALQFRFEKHV